MLRLIEEAGRTCYRSAPSPDLDGAAAFVRRIVDRGHESVIEHVSVSFRITCTRALSHQLVRHRLCSYSQLSQRFAVIDRGDVPEGREYGLFHMPPGLPERVEARFRLAYQAAWDAYREALDAGLPPQVARYPLPNATPTELVMTANLRQWRHMIAQRASPAADGEIRELFTIIRGHFRAALPEIFGEAVKPLWA